jgi:hypothetical protein
MRVPIIRLLFWIGEILVGLFGVWLSVRGLSGDASYAAAFATAVYVVITVKLEHHFAAEDALFRRFPILHSLQRTDADKKLLLTISRYQRISHPLLRQFKEDAWNEFSREITNLYTSKRSESLKPADYIRVIQERLDAARPSDRVVAVSTYGPEEFLDSPHERHFHEAQLRAIRDRGVVVERIFVCSMPRIEDLTRTPYWDDHCGIIQGRFADEADVQAGGLRLSGGFILIGDTLFADRHGPLGLGGIASANEEDVQRALREFAALQSHARQLASVFG